MNTISNFRHTLKVLLKFYYLLASCKLLETPHDYRIGTINKSKSRLHHSTGDEDVAIV